MPICAGVRVSPIALTLISRAAHRTKLTALSLLTLIETWLFWQLRLRPGSERHKPDQTDRLQGTHQTRRSCSAMSGALRTFEFK